MWYILRVRAGREERLRDLLSSHMEVSFPAKRKAFIYVGGRRRYSLSLDGDKDLNIGGVRIRIRDGRIFYTPDPRVRVEVSAQETPLRGYLFVKGNPEEIRKRTENLSDVFGFLMVGGKVRTLTDEELKELERKLMRGERVKSVFPEKGAKVRVVSGEWTGAEGVIEEVHEDMSLRLKLRLWDRTFTATLPLSSVILL